MGGAADILRCGVEMRGAGMGVPKLMLTYDQMQSCPPALPRLPIRAAAKAAAIL
jgi:hypothetical protein